METGELGEPVVAGAMHDSNDEKSTCNNRGSTSNFNDGQGGGSYGAVEPGGGLNPTVSTEDVVERESRLSRYAFDGGWEVTQQGNPSQIRSKRLEREIEVLKGLEKEGYQVKFDETESCLRIMIVVPRELLKEDVATVGDVSFAAIATANFPFKAPELRCESNFTFPSIADGRNLITAVCQSDWSPSFTFCTIFRKLPEFISALVLGSRKHGPVALSVGLFEGLVDLDRYMRDKSTSVVPYRMPNEIAGRRPPRFVIITEGAFLTVVASSAGTSREAEVIDWSHLSHLTSCEKIKGNLSIKFTPSDGKPVQEFNLMVADADSLVRDIRSHVQGLGISTSATTSELIEQENLAIDIAIRKSMLEDSSFEPTLSFVQELMELYQRQVEILAAEDNPAYGSAVDQIRSMLIDPRVASVLDMSAQSHVLQERSSSSDHSSSASSSDRGSTIDRRGIEPRILQHTQPEGDLSCFKR